MIFLRSVKKLFEVDILLQRCYCSHKKIRVRFAPSPTGYLHLGGLRTALYNHLFAKGQNGTTIIRIEDTDQTRKVEGATEKLLEDLKWCGIDYDEGPYFQSKRLSLYQEHLEILLKNETAYKCFCTPTRLDLLRKEALKAREVPKYDNKCRHLTTNEVNNKLKNGETYCIRFKMPSEKCTFNDKVYGTVTFDTSLDGDPVIMKTDGFPTYHFANVVDDHLMGISHVLRGVEWQVSTVKHLLLYRAFQWEPPEYAHLPLLLNHDGSKLSKRQEGIAVCSLRESGIFPVALVNFVIRAGGGFNIEQWEKDERCFSLDELLQKFDIGMLNKNSCKIELEKLNEVNRLEIKRLMEIDENLLVSEVKQYVKDYFKKRKNSEPLQLDDSYIRNILKNTVDRITKLEDLVSEDFSYLWALKYLPVNTNDISSAALEKFYQGIYQLDFKNRETIASFLRQFSKSQGFRFPKFMKTMRLLFTSQEEGPPVAEIIEMLGKENILTILNRRMNQMKMDSVKIEKTI